MFRLDGALRAQISAIESRERIAPEMQLRAVPGDHRSLEREWLFIARSFCADPEKMRLDDAVYLLAHFDSLGGDASVELDLRLGLKEPLPASTTVSDLLQLLADRNE